MNSTALIAPVHLARPNQACPGVGLRWGICQMCRWEMQYEFNSSLEARIQERARIARELHDTLLQSFQGLLLRFQAVANLLPARPQDAKHKLESAIDLTEQAITEGRDAVQGLRRTTLTNDLAMALHALGREFVATWRQLRSHPLPHRCPGGAAKPPSCSARRSVPHRRRSAAQCLPACAGAAYRSGNPLRQQAASVTGSRRWKGSRYQDACGRQSRRSLWFAWNAGARPNHRR